MNNNILKRAAIFFGAELDLNRLGFSSEIDVLVLVFRLVVRMLSLTREECSLMPRQYSSQFSEGVVALAQDGSVARVHMCSNRKRG